MADDTTPQLPSPGLEPIETESYWELGARKYFEGVFEVGIEEQGVEVPEEDVARAVRRYTDMLVPEIRDLVENFMSSEFDFDFDRYASEAS